LGHLKPGDQLPPVREVVRQVTINPNTVHRAYRDLETAGIVEGRPGRGTFVVEVPAPSTTPERQEELQKDLVAWIDSARAAGMNDDAISALVSLSMRMKTVVKEKVVL
jgi:GntR family transcriptional regulator